jgi:hypothetical protein
MLKRYRKTLIYLVGFVTCISYFGCATRGNPQGGPVDRTPPLVVSADPQPDSIHIAANLRTVTIEFSEAMDDGNFSRNVFISPPLEYKLEWKSSRKLEFQLQDSLFDDQTYVISIGSGVQDMHSNRMAESFHLAFSTGDKIDQGQISGRVNDLKRDEIINIFAYDLGDTARPDPRLQKPRYVSQCGPEGKYNLNYLKTGRYRVFAVQDQNSNLLLDAGRERFGIAFRDVVLQDSFPIFTGIHFRLMVEDTLSPKLLSVRPLTNRSLQLRLNKSVLLPPTRSWFIMDSLSGDTLGIRGIYRNIDFNNILDVYTAPMDTAARYKIFIQMLQDSLGRQNYQIQPLAFRPVIKQDTTRFQLILHTPKDSNQSVQPFEKIYLEFSGPADWNKVQQNYTLTRRNGDTVFGRWQIYSAVDAEFIPAHPLHPDSCFYSAVHLTGVQDLWNRAAGDSLVRYSFCIVSERELGQISGRVQSTTEKDYPVYLQVRRTERREAPIIHKLEKAGDFRIEYLPEGKYLTDGFIDEDLSGAYSFGKLAPFEYAEPFVTGQDTIKVRKRWETEGVLITIPGRDRP